MVEIRDFTDELELTDHEETVIREIVRGQKWPVMKAVLEKLRMRALEGFMDVDDGDGVAQQKARVRAIREVPTALEAIGDLEQGEEETGLPTMSKPLA